MKNEHDSAVMYLNFRKMPIKIETLPVSILRDEDPENGVLTLCRVWRWQFFIRLFLVVSTHFIF